MHAAPAGGLIAARGYPRKRAGDHNCSRAAGRLELPRKTLEAKEDQSEAVWDSTEQHSGGLGQCSSVQLYFLLKLCPSVQNDNDTVEITLRIIVIIIFFFNTQSV